ncbi:cytochrome P450 6k1-like [Schistocerca gregaria]|uniref:cytochrome P450 6k1-like n=1 Tax=Schistocerca gregaria TaxID=7010 RepID=UPI00211E25C4|nr:cytochrome P450 6k1-like [Schistocerca gregaria]
MGIYFDSWLTELLVVLSLPIIYIYLKFVFVHYRFWKSRGVPYDEPTFPFGSLRDSFFGKLSMGLTIAKVYRKHKGKKIVGIYALQRPSLIVRDPDLVRTVLVKDFQAFQDRGVSMDKRDPINRHLFALTGNEWKRLRVKLTPTFTSGKLKMMFSTMTDCGRELVSVLEKTAAKGEAEEMRELVARYTTDVIASVAFGINANCLQNPDSEFRQWGRKIFEPSFTKTIIIIAHFLAPALGKLLKFSRSKEPPVTEHFRKMVSDTVKYRETNNVVRNDFMHLLIQLKNVGSVEDDKAASAGADADAARWKLTLDDIAAQAFAFYLGGFETSSTTMSFALHELAVNPDIQRKLQEEIDSVLEKGGEGLTYDAISQMSYLEKVVSETLRKYPIVPILNRECGVDYKFAGSNMVIPKGTPVMISVFGLHRDPEHYPDPERFDPERFTEEAKAKRHPYVYIPFGEGPRNCIGMRFGLLQTKVGLVQILSKFNVETCDKTRANLRFSAKSFNLGSADGIQLKLTKRS